MGKPKNYGSFTPDLEFGAVTVYTDSNGVLTVMGFSERNPPRMKVDDIPILIAMLQKAHKDMSRDEESNED